jgi:hypothetical protein
MISHNGIATVPAQRLLRRHTFVRAILALSRRERRHLLRSARPVTNAIATVLTDQRTLTPGQPLSVYVGMRMQL